MTTETDSITPAVVDRATLTAVAKDLTIAMGRVTHADRIAWQLARSVRDTPETERDLCRINIVQTGGSRRTLTRLAGEATDALLNFRLALAEAEAARRRATDLIRERRDRLADAERATTVAAVEAVVALGDDIQRLNIPLKELDQIVDAARRRVAVVTVTLLRRVHAAAVVAVESQVDAVTARLARLRAEVEAVHTEALAPDAVSDACRGALAAVGAEGLPLPGISFPKWSSAQSKHAKGGWLGDLFATPELTPPDAETSGGSA